MSRAVELLLGLMLLVIGLLVLASEPLGNWFSGLGISEELLAWWPALVVALSAFFLVPAALMAALCLTPRMHGTPRTRLRKVPVREPWSEPPPEVG